MAANWTQIARMIDQARGETAARREAAVIRLERIAATAEPLIVWDEEWTPETIQEAITILRTFQW